MLDQCKINVILEDFRKSQADELLKGQTYLDALKNLEGLLKVAMLLKAKLVTLGHLNMVYIQFDVVSVFIPLKDLEDRVFQPESMLITAIYNKGVKRGSEVVLEALNDTLSKFEE